MHLNTFRRNFEMYMMHTVSTGCVYCLKLLSSWMSGSHEDPFQFTGRSFFAFISCSRWLGFRMDALMFVFLSIASFTAVVVHQQAWFEIDPGILGLALSMLIQLSGLFQWCIRQSAEVVNLVSHLACNLYPIRQYTSL